MYDAIIVGAGPAGSTAALEMARKGYKVAVFEEHEKIGEPVRCAGLVSERVIKMHNEAVVNRIDGADIIFPDGREIHIEKKGHAYVIDRARFDESIAELAMAEGAKYFTGKKIMDVETGNHFEVGGVKARILIGADGANSRMAKMFHSGKMEYVYAIQGYARYEMEIEYVRVYLNHDFAPGFFAWIIPEDEKNVRIGLGATSKNLNSHFKKFLKTIDMEEDSIKKLTAGLIPVKLRKFIHKNIALVGDAAGQTKPTSGGGIYTGMTAAKMLADSVDDITKYEKEYMKKIGRELKKGKVAMKIFAKMNNRMLNMMGKIIDNDVDAINRYGDIDYPSIVIKELVKRHSLFVFKR
ncbi:MAG: NAD(P)/FAD-dependent oxidoreductase [Thermoplasmata archaeon]|nr:NAD(P)/FAD-dependent oxidoreductase [Thermoplasmata archaeon]